MINIKFRTKDFYDKLYRFETSDFYSEELHKVAEYLVSDVKANWSSHSPSVPFNPPAIDLGNFDASLNYKRTVTKHKKIGDTGAYSWSVKFHTQKAGRNYAVALEEGTKNMSPRPYLEPAINRTVAMFPNVKVKVLK